MPSRVSVIKPPHALITCAHSSYGLFCIVDVWCVAAQSTGGVVVVLIRWRGCWCFEWCGCVGWVIDGVVGSTDRLVCAYVVCLSSRTAASHFGPGKRHATRMLASSEQGQCGCGGFAARSAQTSHAKGPMRSVNHAPCTEHTCLHTSPACFAHR